MEDLTASGINNVSESNIIWWHFKLTAKRLEISTILTERILIRILIFQSCHGVIPIVTPSVVALHWLSVVDYLGLLCWSANKNKKNIAAQRDRFDSFNNRTNETCIDMLPWLNREYNILLVNASTYCIHSVIALTSITRTKKTNLRKYSNNIRWMKNEIHSCASQKYFLNK